MRVKNLFANIKHNSHHVLYNADKRLLIKLITRII